MNQQELEQTKATFEILKQQDEKFKYPYPPQNLTTTTTTTPAPNTFVEQNQQQLLQNQSFTDKNSPNQSISSKFTLRKDKIALRRDDSNYLQLSQETTQKVREQIKMVEQQVSKVQEELRHQRNFSYVKSTGQQTSKASNYNFKEQTSFNILSLFTDQNYMLLNTLQQASLMNGYGYDSVGNGSGSLANLNMLAFDSKRTSFQETEKHPSTLNYKIQEQKSEKLVMDQQLQDKLNEKYAKLEEKLILQNLSRQKEEGLSLQNQQQIHTGIDRNESQKTYQNQSVFSKNYRTSSLETGNETQIASQPKHIVEQIKRSHQTYNKQTTQQNQQQNPSYKVNQQNNQQIIENQEQNSSQITYLEQNNVNKEGGIVYRNNIQNRHQRNLSQQNDMSFGIIPIYNNIEKDQNLEKQIDKQRAMKNNEQYQVRQRIQKKEFQEDYC